MVGPERLHHLRQCVETVLGSNIPGDFIETGVWRGGCCLLMREILRGYGITDRKVYVADSFCGVPEPRPHLYPVDSADRHHTFTSLRISRSEVERNFTLPDEQVVFVEGWFRDTLPNINAEFALLRLDGDMYESTMDALVNLYHRLSPGGFVIIDDWNLPHCRKAVWDFLRARDLRPTIIVIDEFAVYWKKYRKESE